MGLALFLVYLVGAGEGNNRSSGVQDESGLHFVMACLVRAHFVRVKVIEWYGQVVKARIMEATTTK